MTLLFLEAFGAMVLLIFIVWWTMFSGRKNGELKREPEEGVEGKEGIKGSKDHKNKQDPQGKA